MVRRSFAVREIIEILLHWQAGRPLRQIARSLGVDRNTLRKFVALAVSLGYRAGETRLSAEEWAVVLATHIPELGQPHPHAGALAEIGRYRQAIVAGLQTNKPATVWQRLHDEQGLQGSLRSFYRYLDCELPEYSKKGQPTVLRDDPPPGREVQIDYGYLGLWTDRQIGKARKVWAFCMVFSHSRHMFVHVVTKMDQEAWITAHVAAFEFFGGVPLLLVVDNLKAGVLHLTCTIRSSIVGTPNWLPTMGYSSIPVGWAIPRTSRALSAPSPMCATASSPDVTLPP